MNVYDIVKKYYSHVSKRKTPRMDAAESKLYSVMTWDAKLVTSWELQNSLTGWQDQFYTVDTIGNHKKTIYISSVMFLEEYMNIYI